MTVLTNLLLLAQDHPQGLASNAGQLGAGQSWGLVTVMEIVGPLVLGLGLAYGILRAGRRRNAADRHRADAVTRQNYEVEERQRRQSGRV
jgi:heme/copper-type cytochrome/quinol oxidase subunit 2